MDARALRAHAMIALAAAFAVACSEDLPGVGTNLDATEESDTGADPADSGIGTLPDAAPAADATAAPDAAAMRPDGADRNDPANARKDTDCDGLSDAYEFSTIYPGGRQTDPANPDSDGDGIPDGVEMGVSGPVPGSACASVPSDADTRSRTSPTAADSDGDGIADGVEDANHDGKVDAAETDPSARDTDLDGIADGVEDANQNGRRDMGELDPTKRDTDGDGIADGVEDANHNGRTDSGETNPLSMDSDGDQVLDGDEDTNHDGTRQPYEIDPRSADTDCDGLTDREELSGTTSPLVADSDGDGIPDGVEVGRTQAVAGTSCPGFAADQDPATMTPADRADGDGDGLPDGTEDANHNGRVDMGETNPASADSDGDGIPDGDEVLAGTNPNAAGDPSGIVLDGVRSICADGNLKPVDFDVDTAGDWTVANEPSASYAAIPVSQSGVNAAALDDAGNGVAGFVVAMPPLGGAVNLAGQAPAFAARMAAAAAAEGLTLTVRQSPRNVTTHDGFEAAVSGVVEIATASDLNASQVRNALLRMSTGLGAGAFTNLPGATGAPGRAYVMGYELLVRAADMRVLVVAGVMDRPRFDDTSDPRSFQIADLTNGTALARANAPRGKACDGFTAARVAKADFIWMADISSSTDDDRGRIVSSAQQVFDALTMNGVDFRMSVVPHSQSTIHQPSNNGNLRGAGFTTDRTAFTTYLQDTSNTDGCEFGIDAVSAAITRALPRSAPGSVDARKIRGDATLAVVYVSDEHAQEVEEGPCYNMPQRRNCPTGIGDVYTEPALLNACAVPPNATQQACVNTLIQRYIDQLRANNAVVFAQVFDPNPPGQCNTAQFRCQGSAQDRNEGGNGYVEVVNAMGGLYYSPCLANPGAGPLRAIVDAVTGAASEFRLRSPPISASIKVGLTRAGGTPMTLVVPRDKSNGFDYDASSNSIFFRGNTYRPREGDRVTVSYRVWRAPTAPCGGACAPNQVCDPMLGVCGCDQAACNMRCGPNQVCDGSCNCACAPDCNGRCGQGQTCNQATCQCECAADCGGCPAGTMCNRNSCQCECAGCGGACNANPGLSCDVNACACTCPADCGGRCTGTSTCNPTSCACDCGPACNAGCDGRRTCNPASGCGCECPANCGGCPDGTTCDSAACECVCPAGCNASCQNRQVCDPNNNCACICPQDCGGCNAGEVCDPVGCRCIPGV